MIHSSNNKSEMLFMVNVTNAAITATFDTLDFKTLQVDVMAPTVSDTTVILSACKLEESDITTEASMATWSGSSVTSFAHTTIASPEVSQRFNVSLLGRKRYMMLEVTGAGAAQVMAAQARLSRGEVFANNTTDANVIKLCDC